MAEKENKPNWDFQEAPAATLNSVQLVSYLAKNKIKVRGKADNMTRFAKNNGIKYVEVRRSGSFGSNPHYFYPPAKSKMESIISELKNNNTSFNGR